MIPDKLTVLVLGSGGREHALAWCLSRSPRVARLVCAPGNPGMAALAELRACSIENMAEVDALARDVRADLVIVGPEAPLAAGVSDALRSAGFVVFGPSRQASRLEWDKRFAKEFMERYGVPTAAFESFTKDTAEQGEAFIRSLTPPIVLKASGLAAGKGVVIAPDYDYALREFGRMLSGEAFGTAGSVVVVEEFMAGEEASIFAICDGTDYVLLAPSQDHKCLYDGDTGPNTGGMGAYAPAPIVTKDLLKRVSRQIIEPTLEGMRSEGTPYTGCLYVGLMINQGDARVVEFNSRFGDPEAQVVLPLLTSDFAELAYAAAAGELDTVEPPLYSGTAVCVVIASQGYPGNYPQGVDVSGLDDAAEVDGVVVFHSGTASVPGDQSNGDADTRLVSAGGRVLGVTAISSSNDLRATIDSAYQAVEKIMFDGGVYRRDIGRRGLEHLRQD